MTWWQIGLTVWGIGAALALLGGFFAYRSEPTAHGVGIITLVTLLGVIWPLTLGFLLVMWTVMIVCWLARWCGERLRLVAMVPMLMLTLPAAMCGTPEVQTRVETVTVNVPVRAPCPEAADIPTLPRRVSEEHPVMPTVPDGPDADSDPDPDYAAISRILAAKVLEWAGVGAVQHGLLTECARPSP